ncbi:MAG: hypothetical protein AB1861_00090 [Cyanobacteriota bacterium]
MTIITNPDNDCHIWAPLSSQDSINQSLILERYAIFQPDISEEKAMKIILTIRWLIQIIVLQFITLSVASLLLLWFARSGW